MNLISNEGVQQVSTTAAKTKKKLKPAKRSHKQVPANLAKRVIDMFIKAGNKKVTRYNCGVIKEAKADKCNIRIIKEDKAVVVKPRMVDRSDLFAAFGPTHAEKAGKGKYLDLDMVSKDFKVVTGADHINPYLADNGSYATIVQVFKHDIGKSNLENLKADVRTTRIEGEHLKWRGKRNKDDCIIASPWRTEEELWNMALKLNPNLRQLLNKAKSQRKGVKKHFSAPKKFFQNINVLRRATKVVNIATGTAEYQGGATPYSKPLEQAGFAIDLQYKTTGINANGEETGDYFYRMVIGRSEPHVFYYRDWKYEDDNSDIAFKDDKARQSVKAFHTKQAV